MLQELQEAAAKEVRSWHVMSSADTQFLRCQKHRAGSHAVLSCLGAQVQAFEAVLAKDHKQVMNSLTGATNAAKKKLADKFHTIEDLNAKYQQVSCVSAEPFQSSVRRSVHQHYVTRRCSTQASLLGLSSRLTQPCVCWCWCWCCLGQLQDIKTAWDDYTAVYNKFDDTKRAVSASIDNCWHRKWTRAVGGRGPALAVQGRAPALRGVWCCVLHCMQASAQMEKLRTNHKRKLSELQASLQGRVGETQQKLVKLNSKAGKASGLDGMLKQFMG